MRQDWTSNLETPVKDEIKLPNLENLLTPETDEENSTEGALPIKESAKRCFPYQVDFNFKTNWYLKLSFFDLWIVSFDWFLANWVFVF